jgi:Ca2+-binding EF-hand superfamily protein
MAESSTGRGSRGRDAAMPAGAAPAQQQQQQQQQQWRLGDTELRAALDVVARRGSAGEGGGGKGGARLVPRAQAGVLLQQLGVEVAGEPELLALLAAVPDPRADGLLNVSQFAQLMAAFYAANDTREEVEEAFAALRVSSGAGITAESMLKLFRQMGESTIQVADCARVIELLGGSGAKQISFEAFQTHMLASK